MHWFENVRPMREPWKLDNKKYLATADAINVQEEDELFGKDWLDNCLTDTILDAKYEEVDVEDVSRQQKTFDSRPTARVGTSIRQTHQNIEWYIRSISS